MQYLIRNLLSMRQSLLFLKSYRFLKKWQRGKNTGKRGNFGFVFDVQANLFKSREQYRGVSFAIGASESWCRVATLPNFLRVFNPNLVGGSVNTGGEFDAGSNLNLAR